MTKYDSYRLEEWFWATFEPTPTWPNLDFGQLFIWPDMTSWRSDEWLWAIVNQLQLDLILTFGQLMNFWYELGKNDDQICISGWMIFSNIRTDFNLTLFLFLVNFLWPVIGDSNKRGINYITERSVRWYYGFSITATAASRPRRRWTLLTRKVFNVSSFKFYMRVNTPLRFVAIEIWYPSMTRTTAFAAKRHSYPPNFQNAISP